MSRRSQANLQQVFPQADLSCMLHTVACLVDLHEITVQILTLRKDDMSYSLIWMPVL